MIHTLLKVNPCSPINKSIANKCTSGTLQLRSVNVQIQCANSGTATTWLPTLRKEGTGCILDLRKSACNRVDCCKDSEWCQLNLTPIITLFIIVFLSILITSTIVVIVLTRVTESISPRQTNLQASNTIKVTRIKSSIVSFSRDFAKLCVALATRVRKSSFSRKAIFNSRDFWTGPKAMKEYECTECGCFPCMLW